MTDDPVDSILQSISEGRVQSFNEAQTRHRIIDPIIYDVLKWGHDDVTVEDRVSEDGQHSFIDYHCRTAQVSLLIEAKRLSIPFDDLPTIRRTQLKGSWLKGAVKEAIHQARDYGRQIGAGFCAVTNGDAWIIFPVNRRDAVTFEQSSAIIFPQSTSALQADVEEFTALLSRAAVIDGALESMLLGGRINQSDTRRLNQIYEQSFTPLSRNPLYRHLEDEIATAFSDELLSENPDLMRRVYVTTAERTRFDERIGMTIRRRDQVLRTSPVRPMSKGGFDRARDLIEIRVKAKPTVLLTLGLVGAGKTTFLHYVRHVSSSEFFSAKRKNPGHWIYVDFRDFSKSENPHDHIVETCFSYISKSTQINDYKNFISSVYKEEIAQNVRGILSLLANDQEEQNRAIFSYINEDVKKRDPYVIKILSFLKNKSPVYIVVDNVDQIEEPSIQERIFLDALALSRRVGSNLILAMRDYTYVKNRNGPAFDAFDFDAIYIDPPPVAAVLSSRFRLAEQLASGHSIQDHSASGARIEIEDAAEVIGLMRTSVLATNVGHIIDVAATGDIRLALKMTRQFLQYGYSSSLETFLQFRTGKKIFLAEHEAIRALMYGNQLIYKDQYSAFLNPFDAKMAVSEAQFLRLYILNALVNMASESSFNGIEARELIANLEKIGFSERVSEAVVSDLIAGRLVFTHSHQPYSRDSVISPSRFGGYVVRELISTFVFLEATLLDTFIYNDETWDRLRSLFKKIYAERNPMERLGQRANAVQAFYEFCTDGVDRIVQSAHRHGLPAHWLVNPMQRARTTFDINVGNVIKSGERNLAPGGGARR